MQYPIFSHFPKFLKSPTTFPLILIFSMFSLFMTTSCSTYPKSLATGATAGVAMGATVGAIAYGGVNGRHRSRNIVMGSLVGGALGMLTGHLIHDNKNEKVMNSNRTENEEMFRSWVNEYKIGNISDDDPSLTKPEIEKIWIPETVRGKIYSQGHWQWRIKRGTSWKR